MMKTLIGVMGAGEHATERDVAWAEALGQAIAERGWVVLSGGRDVGVMAAVNRGAKVAGGLTVGILLGADKTDGVCADVDIVLATGMGSARNNINVLSSDVVVACGSLEAGTLSEVALAIKGRRPLVILNDDPNARLFIDKVGRGAVRWALTVDDAMTAVADLVGAR